LRSSGLYDYGPSYARAEAVLICFESSEVKKEKSINFFFAKLIEILHIQSYILQEINARCSRFLNFVGNQIYLIIKVDISLAP
jgi:hypothetical protein